MLNQLSLKIGLLFFVVVITVEIILFSILYTNLVNDRVDEVMGDLLARGNTHRDVLEENYTSSTLNHVAIMESESDFIVVITDRNGEVVTSSNPMEPKMAAVIEHTDNDQVPDEASYWSRIGRMKNMWRQTARLSWRVHIVGMYSCLSTATISKKSSAVSLGNFYSSDWSLSF